MPSNYVKSLSEKYELPVNILEKAWKEAKKLSGGKSEKDMKWGLMTKIFKNIINKRYETNESVNKFINIKIIEENYKG